MIVEFKNALTLLRRATAFLLIRTLVRLASASHDTNEAIRSPLENNASAPGCSLTSILNENATVVTYQTYNELLLSDIDKHLQHWCCSNLERETVFRSLRNVTNNIYWWSYLTSRIMKK